MKTLGEALQEALQEIKQKMQQQRFELKNLKRPIDLGFIEITKSYTETKTKEKRK